MIRKLMCFAILTTMGLHCASRLGTISYLFENRHAIAFSIGLISEKPIAICSSSYHYNKELKISLPESDQKMPDFAQAQDINLYCVDLFQFPEQAIILADSMLTFFHPLNYPLGETDPVFHPPLV